VYIAFMISKSDIEGLAKLARLQLSDAEKESLGKDVSSILDYVGQVAAVSGEAVGPKAPPHHNVMRDDAVRPESDQIAGKEEAVRAQFPTQEPARPDDTGHSGGGSYNVVRKIIQKDE
jgi:aspartyl-tRNA(Asn)/glutamyl-tRNA(Gln) amidotransferase subunit C